MSSLLDSIFTYIRTPKKFRTGQAQHLSGCHHIRCTRDTDWATDGRNGTGGRHNKAKMQRTIFLKFDSEIKINVITKVHSGNCGIGVKFNDAPPTRVREATSVGTQAFVSPQWQQAYADCTSSASTNSISPIAKRTSAASHQPTNNKRTNTSSKQ